MRIYLKSIVMFVFLICFFTSWAYPFDAQYEKWLIHGFPLNPEKAEVEIFLFELTTPQFDNIEQIRTHLLEIYRDIDPQASNKSTLELLHKSFLVVKYWIEDINNDGKLELIAQLDTSGSGWPQELIIVCRDKDNFRFQKIEARDSDVIDLGKKGKVIIAYKTISPYRGRAYPWAYWPQTYKWNGAEVAVTSDIPEFYTREVIPKAEKKINEIADASHLSAEEREEFISLERMIISKSQRFAKINGKAGFKEAQEWFNSNNKKLRENALYVFFDIADGESTQILKKAQEDKDPDIAREAKSFVEKLKK